MRLLTDVMDHPLDPGYEAAARRRAAGGATGGARRSSALAAGVLAALLGALLVTAAQVAAAGRPDADRGRQELLQRVEERTAAADALAGATARLRAENERLQSRVAGAGAAADAERADALAPAVGALPVTGPGLEVVLADAAADAAGEATEGRVVDRDLQLLVNGLWAAGAEAVAVDGQRLTALSAIRSAGAAVLVNYRPLVPPYEVEAVGDPAALQTGLAASPAGSYLRALEDNYGIGVSITRRDELLLPAADTVGLRLAQPPGAPPAAGALPSPPVDASGEGRS
ncbi:uncharacterized protein YlxW (UPF0749 family) [Kineococcus xinjiangensis]|uniref:Uncharacterized protein YlxW (UPF0749 family) n=2 Tax=Kineococcus xinjiangensis TaxID=512762 RepID=A0A2S6ID84_9ACTN|nr:uncharacterized protein YlxW (UPF0749 family) [Kineococcus xinjiangensis]